MKASELIEILQQISALTHADPNVLLESEDPLELPVDIVDIQISMFHGEVIIR